MKRFFALALLGLVAFIGCAPAEEGGAPAAPDAGTTAPADGGMDAGAPAPADAGATDTGAAPATPAESPAP